MILILSKPFILISSSIKSSSKLISGLQVGTSTFIPFFSFLHLKPKDDNILLVSLGVIGIPINFSNFSIPNLIILLFSVGLPVITNLLASPPQILIINSKLIIFRREIYKKKIISSNTIND